MTTCRVKLPLDALPRLKPKRPLTYMETAGNPRGRLHIEADPPCGCDPRALRTLCGSHLIDAVTAYRRRPPMDTLRKFSDPNLSSRRLCPTCALMAPDDA